MLAESMNFSRLESLQPSVHLDAAALGRVHSTYMNKHLTLVHSAVYAIWAPINIKTYLVTRVIYTSS
jgi:hypothetical protein